MLPPLTPYYIMRVGKCAVSPYRIPGDAQLADDISRLAADYHCVVLAHHGPVVAGPTLDEAVATLEELEENAKLYLLLRNEHYNALDAVALSELQAKYPSPAP
jgi:ribulose-5-phosphate 4-epimerase/fuculose-1-phosphate aldolase